MGSKSKKTKTKSIPGIPDNISIEDIRQWVKKRVSSKRYEHIKGVVKVGELLSYHQNINPQPVLLACWLHDSCKEVKSEKLIELAKKFKLPLTKMEEKYGHILHGPVAAEVAKEKFAITNNDVLSGIAEHTLGGINMTTISKIVYLADALEESRPQSIKQPIYKALAKDVDLHSAKSRVKLDLDNAMFQATNLTLYNLLERGKTIHPKTVAVRNHYLEIVNSK